MDVTNIPDLLRLAEEVRETQTPRVLKQGDDEIAVVTPAVPRAGRARKRAKSAHPNDWLQGLIGIADSGGPGDVSENKYKYLAEAYYGESHQPTDE